MQSALTDHTGLVDPLARLAAAQAAAYNTVQAVAQAVEHNAEEKTERAVVEWVVDE